MVSHRAVTGSGRAEVVQSQADIARKIRTFQILRGRHSAPGQRYRHGWIPIGDDGADTFVGTMRDEATIRKAYDYHDEPTGLTARVSKITDHGPGEPVEVEVTIHDRNGNKVGEAGRVVERDGHGMYHDALTLDGPVQGQGFATRYNQNAERTYRAAGIDEIRLLANDDVGGRPPGQADAQRVHPRRAGDHPGRP